MVKIERFLEENQGKTYKELIEVRRGLQKEIDRLEILLLSPDRDSEEWQLEPNPFIQYHMNIIYLNALSVFIGEIMLLECRGRVDDEKPNIELIEIYSSEWKAALFARLKEYYGNKVYSEEDFTRELNSDIFLKCYEFFVTDEGLDDLDLFWSSNGYIKSILIDGGLSTYELEE